MTPRTLRGKLATILYAIVGMPLFLLYLSNIGDILAKSFKWIYAKCCLCRGCKKRRKRMLAMQRKEQWKVRQSATTMTFRASSPLTASVPRVYRARRRRARPQRPVDARRPVPYPTGSRTDLWRTDGRRGRIIALFCTSISQSFVLKPSFTTQFCGDPRYLSDFYGDLFKNYVQQRGATINSLPLLYFRYLFLPPVLRKKNIVTMFVQ